MKIFVFILFFLSIESCNFSNQRQDDFYYDIKNPILVKEINEFAIRNKIKSRTDEIICVSLDTSATNEVTAVISTVIYLSEIKDNVPCNYTKINEINILLYGKTCKKPCINCENKWNFFKKLSKDKLINDLGDKEEKLYSFAPVSFDPEVYIVKTKNNILVESFRRK